VIAAEQYDVLPILKKWKPVDANEYAEEIQNKNLTPAFKLMGLSKYAATISLSPVQFGVKQKQLQPNFRREWKTHSDNGPENYIGTRSTSWLLQHHLPVD
jgi:hypothetical protein